MSRYLRAVESPTHFRHDRIRLFGTTVSPPLLLALIPVNHMSKRFAMIITQRLPAACVRARRLRLLALGSSVLTLGACVADTRAASRNAREVPGAAGEPYPQMPSVAPIGERIGKYIDVPASAKGPAIDPAKGYRLQDLGGGLYMITDNAYQSMLLLYDKGVVVIDAPPAYSAHLPQAIAE